MVLTPSDLCLCKLKDTPQLGAELELMDRGCTVFIKKKAVYIGSGIVRLQEAADHEDEMTLASNGCMARSVGVVALVSCLGIGDSNCSCLHRVEEDLDEIKDPDRRSHPESANWWCLYHVRVHQCLQLLMSQLAFARVLLMYSYVQRQLSRAAA
ncbi:hypothetical protein EJB05_33539, partial [Eragrostis curvula]